MSLLFHLLLYEIASFWQTWLPANCLPDRCFCEAINRVSVLKQPANTWSSYAFVVAGLFIHFIYPRAVASSLRYSPAHLYIFSISSVLVGFGSAFYHASLTFIGQFFDVFGMYLLANFLLVYSVERLWNLKRVTALFMYVFLTVTFAFLLLTVPETRRFLFAIILIIGIIL